MRGVALATLLLFAAGNASGEPTKSIFGDATYWRSRPSEAEVVQAAPKGVSLDGGRAIMACKAAPDGRLSECQVLHETPATGLGKAILSLAPKYLLKPEAVNKAAPNGWVTIRESWSESDKQPDWLRRPTAEDLKAAWPVRAWAAGIGGRADLDCLVTVSGGLFDCVALNETPAGQGFADAALVMTPQFNMRPAQRGGAAVVSDIIIPIRFKMPGGVETGGPAGRELPPPSVPLLPPVAKWAETPGRAEIAAAFPSAARAAKISGLVAMACKLTNDGRLGSCFVDRDEPKGAGFDKAAKLLVQRFRIDPADVDGGVANRQIALRIAFDTQLLDDAKPIFGKTVVLAQPTFEQVIAAQTATKTVSIAGRAVIGCTIGASGRLENCKAESEEPAGSGLGQTALALKDDFRMSTWSEEGLPIIGQRIRIPLRFEKIDEVAAAKP